MALPFPVSNMVSVTVQPNMRVERAIDGVLYVYSAGAVLIVPANDAIYLRRDKVVV